MIKKSHKCLLFTLILFSFIAYSCSDSDKEIDKPGNIKPTINKPYTIRNITPTGKKWEVVPIFTDEFDGPKIDGKWNLDPQGHSDLNWPGRTPALFQKENFEIIDGEMTIKVGVLPQPITISPYGSPLTYKYHGGIMRSRTTTGVGNYYECRMKMSKTEMGGGFWLMGKGICGKKHEIDIHVHSNNHNGLRNVGMGAKQP